MVGALRTVTAKTFLSAIALLTAITSAEAGFIAADASIFNFANQGTVTNLSSGGVTITDIIFDLGGPADQIGTWDSSGGSRIPVGGTASDYLSDPNYFQTISFTGLSVAGGGTYAWSNLDMDLILTALPLTFTSGPFCTSSGCTYPTVLDLALFTVGFSDGTRLSSGFDSGNISQQLDLQLRSPSSVPLPATIWLFISGLGALGVFMKKRRTH